MNPQESPAPLGAYHTLRRHVELARRHGRQVVARTIEVRNKIDQWRLEHLRRRSLDTAPPA